MAKKILQATKPEIKLCCDKSDRNKAGIYKIENTVNGRVYIGATSCFQRRNKEHFKNLRLGYHRAKRMQKDWDNQAGSGFVMSPLRFSNKRPSIEEEMSVLEAFRSNLGVDGTYNSIRTHGWKGTTTYQSWIDFRRNSCETYPKEWDEFPYFLEALGEKPFEKCVVSRVSQSKPLSNSNCCWSRQSKLGALGKKHKLGSRWASLADWGREFDVDYKLLWHRVESQGWDLSKALAAERKQVNITPDTAKQIRIEHSLGRSRRELRNIYNLSKSQIARIVRGQSFPDAGGPII